MKSWPPAVRDGDGRGAALPSRRLHRGSVRGGFRAPRPSAGAAPSSATSRRRRRSAAGPGAARMDDLRADLRSPFRMLGRNRASPPSPSFRWPSASAPTPRFSASSTPSSCAPCRFETPSSWCSCRPGHRRSQRRPALSGLRVLRDKTTSFEGLAAFSASLWSSSSTPAASRCEGCGSRAVSTRSSASRQ